MKTFHAICALLCLLALSACSQKETLPASGLYTVAMIEDSAVDAGQPISVTLEDGRLSGNGPVNRWNVPVLADGKLGVGISTRMAGSPELMALESKLLQALDGGTLQATAHKGLEVVKDGKVVIVLKPVRPEPSGGGTAPSTNQATKAE